ncbi:hypothetical protein FA13DRAFT_606841 [Coprinellus micaceus]|uniref:Uncharacterized protein n=1 Tax=Coprinellus micaceus TaxID=71717 RepID=A0A4Y7T737_COPMI|nr:hypothetical protein FA13DRAFT_606841 [Coprinellus micaceus]
MARRKDFGNDLFTEEDRPEQALFQFWSTAQLAAAIVGFDLATNWQCHRCLIRARKELVPNLGNAAEMALSLEKYDRAYVFALAALKVSKPEVTTPDEPVGPAVWEKNKKRLARARAAVGKDSSEAGAVPRNVGKRLLASFRSCCRENTSKDQAKRRSLERSECGNTQNKRQHFAIDDTLRWHSMLQCVGTDNK